ncbi:MAG: hypothetical protein AUI14_20015 [Actinobacteria bacterium 13_2_20CM_2_71_6]|nr:MAG: hypothetical protein AUI14_20015 [Actinobacteria bacterium 13_2_20CM_2_71_6]
MAAYRLSASGTRLSTYGRPASRDGRPSSASIEQVAQSPGGGGTTVRGDEDDLLVVGDGEHVAVDAQPAAVGVVYASNTVANAGKGLTNIPVTPGG